MHNKKLKTCLLAGVMAASLLMVPMDSYAEGWVGVLAPAVGGLITYLVSGIPNVMAAVNVDPAQLVLEYLVYDAQKEVTYEWEPEPEESYEKAAEANENGSQCGGSSSASSTTDAGTVNFEVQVLEAKGIEAVGLEGTTSALATSAGRQTALEGLTSLTTNQSGNLSFNKEMTTTEITTLITTQKQNEQWQATAAIARAELGLLAAQQAAADDGSGETDMQSSSLTDDRNEIASATAGSQGKSLAGLAGTGTSTGSAMRIQALMNLELAQRINLSDTLQGGILSLQAARVIRTTDPNEESNANE